MGHEIRIDRIIPAPRDEVFNFNTHPYLLEKWNAPDGMTLKVPIFEARKDGKFRYEHTNGEDVYICNGHFEEFIPNEKLVQIENVDSASTGTMFEHLRTEVNFTDVEGGTKISAIQSGFSTQQDADDCKRAWDQCLDKLSHILTHQRFRPGQELRSQQVSER